MPEVFEQYYSLFDRSASQRLELIRFNPGYKVFYEDNTSIEIKGDVDVDRHTFEALEAGAGKKLEKYVAKSSLAYKIAVEYFLYNNFSRMRDFLKWPIIKHSPQMLSLVVKNLDSHVGQFFNNRHLKQILEYHMVFLGSSPFQAPAIYTLISYLDFKTGVFYPKKGMLSLVDDMLRISKNYDISYHYDTAVTKIVTKQGSADGVVINGELIRADVVISNADLEFTETKLLDEAEQSYPIKYWQQRQPGPSGLMISLGIKGKLDNLKHHNLYFVDDWEENFRSIYEDKKVPTNTSIYVCNPSQTDRSLSPDSHENIFILMPLPAGVSLSDKDTSKLVDKSIDILEKMTGQPNLSSRIVSRFVFGPDDVSRRYNAWQNNAFGGESHLLRQSIIFRTGNKSKKLNNLYYVGAGTLPGIGLPMCLISAEQTFKKITGNKKAGRLTKDEI